MEEFYLAFRTFILYNIHYLMFDEYEFPNISFNFKEVEARKEIFKFIMKELELNFGSISLTKADKIVRAINDPDYSKPVVEIKNYKKFFTNLNELISTEGIFDRESLLKQLWLRMTPEDFKNPEDFIKKNSEILRNKVFNKYTKETVIDNPFFKDYILTVETTNTFYFNESMKEMCFRLSNYETTYQLPVVRYGIYKKNNEMVCEIGSIQHLPVHFKDSELEKIEKKIDRLKYKLNKEVPIEYTENIEPKNLISLLLFINLLKKEGITKIVVPAMYPLDYEYHEKRKRRIEYFLNNRWESSDIDTKQLDKELDVLSRTDRIDEISASKTTNYIKLFERLMYHLEDSHVVNYPGELSNYLEIKIDSVNNIKGEHVKELLKR